MLFKVIMRISIPVGADGVTPEDRADGFTSEWAALPIAVPQARAILLATFGYPGDGQRTSPDGLHVDYISPETNGDFLIESGRCQLWAVRVEFQADWIHYRLRAHFRGLEEQKLLAFRTAKSQWHPITCVLEDIMVKVKLCCDVEACIQQLTVYHKEALRPLQKSIDIMNSQINDLQHNLVVRLTWEIQMQHKLDAMLAKNHRSQRCLIVLVVLVSAILAFA